MTGRSRFWRRASFWKRFHLARVIVWIVLIPVALLTGMKESVPFLVTLSIVAPLLSDLASWRVDSLEDDHDEPPTCDQIADAVVFALGVPFCAGRAAVAHARCSMVGVGGWRCPVCGEVEP